jgi:hypothetical protein
MPRLASALLVLSLVAPLSACASQKTSAEPVPAPVASEMPREWEPWPPASAAPVTRQAPADTGEVVKLLPKEGGWKVEELFDQVSKTLGVSILYDGYNATFKQAKIEFVGPFTIAQKDLFPWLQAVLSYRKLVLVPVGPRSPDGKQQWTVMDQADPNLKSRPVYVDENEILDYADRDGLYIVTSLRCRDTVETNAARNALSPLSTQTAGIGRIQDVPGSRALVVGDFAPVVAAMKRMLDYINEFSTPTTPEPPAPTPTPSK